MQTVKVNRKFEISCWNIHEMILNLDWRAMNG